MTEIQYHRAALTYEPIENIPENKERLEALGLSLDTPGVVVVWIVELQQIDGPILSSMEEFNVRFHAN